MDNYNEILNSLFTQIAEDKKKAGSYQRTPIRFIMLSSYPLLKTIIEELAKSGVKIIELSKSLVKEDGWINQDKIKQIIEELPQENDFMVLGVSEFSRFYKKNSFDALMFSLLDIENKNNKYRRIYLPFIGLENALMSTLSRHHRKNEFTPYYRVDSNISTLKFYITDIKVNKEFDECVLDSTTNWLNFWKRSEELCNDIVICSSETLNYWYNSAIPDNVIIMEQITNVKDLLLRIKNINIPIEYKEDETIFWQKLITEEYLKESISFEYILKKAFNLSDVHNINIVRHWFENGDAYKRWLLKSFVTYAGQNTYIYEVFCRLQSYDDLEFANLLWLTIFEQGEKEEVLCNERINLLRELVKYIPVKKLHNLEDTLLDKINQLSMIKEKVNVISGITDVEKELVIGMFKNSQIDKKVLKEKFSLLYSYLDEVSFDNNHLSNYSWITEYMKEYKLSKLTDTVTPKLESLLTEKNRSSESFYEWYNQLPYVQDILNSETVNRTIVIDALGFEWISLVEKVLENNNIIPLRKCVAKSHLPTVTHCNKEITHDTWIPDFDKLLHQSGHYKYPRTFVSQLKKLEDIIDLEIGVMENEKIAIVADHGSSVFPRLVSKLYDFDESEHDGRCMKTEKDFTDNEDFFIYQTYNNEKWAVCLNYSSLNNKPSRAVHGGATPEEVLVPVLILTKEAHGKKKITYKIKLDRDEIDIKNPTISISIEPTPNVAPKVTDDDGAEFLVSYNSSRYMWEVDLKNLKKEYILVKLHGFSKKFKVNFKRAMKERDLFE